MEGGTVINYLCDRCGLAVSGEKELKNITIESHNHSEYGEFCSACHNIVHAMLMEILRQKSKNRPPGKEGDTKESEG
jgi:hypothetical protein